MLNKNLSIKIKLTTLLLTTALIPSLLIIITFNTSLGIADKNIKHNFHELMNEKASWVLLQHLDNFNRLAEAEKSYIEEALNSQARELGFFIDHYNNKQNVDSSILNDITYITGEDNSNKNDSVEINAISEYMKTARRICNERKVIIRNITVLKNGAVAIYPAINNSTRQSIVNNSDIIKWYKDSLNEHAASQPDSNHIIRRKPDMDITNNEIVITTAKICYDKDGNTLGITAYEVSSSLLFDNLTVDSQWGKGSVKAIIGLNNSIDISIFPQLSSSKSNTQNQQEITPAIKEAIHKDLTNFRSGMLNAKYNSKDCLWLYSLSSTSNFATLLIIPTENIIAAADKIHDNLTRQGELLLKTGLAIIILAIGISVLLALSNARKITTPIQQITQSAQMLGNGKFDINVDIKTGDEIETLGNVFNDIGPQLAQRQQMQKTLQLAKDIQINLLPHENPKLENYDIAGSCCYCDETGGDYYDFITLGENSKKVMAVIGDVTGHGVPAALLMASARATIRSLSDYCNDNIAELLTKFNQHFLDDTGGTRFITMFTCIIDSNTDLVHWASGGHDPALLYSSSNGEFNELENTGMLIGVIENVTYSQSGPVQLHINDIIVIGTDGIWEARDQYGNLFGKDRLKDLIHKNSALNAQQLTKLIFSEVQDFSKDSSISDDITMIIIKKSR